MTTFPAGRSHAEGLDAADPLAGFRDRLVRDDPELIYLDGNSLGPLPRATQARIAEVLTPEQQAKFDKLREENKRFLSNMMTKLAAATPASPDCFLAASRRLAAYSVSSQYASRSAEE